MTQPRESQRIPMSLRLEPDLVEKLKAQAETEHRSINNTIEIAIINYLTNAKKRK